MSLAISKNKRLWLCILIVFVCGIALAYMCFIHPHLLSLPRISDIESMHAEIFESDTEVKSFEVDPSDFSKVLRPLAPARRDWLPADWASIGRISIRSRDGSHLIINLYRTGKPTGAFSLGTQIASSDSIISNYFRGGRDDQIEAGLRQAYWTSTRQNK